MLMRYRDRQTGELVLATRFKSATLVSYPWHRADGVRHLVHLCGYASTAQEGDWLVVPEDGSSFYHVAPYVLGNTDFQDRFTGATDRMLSDA
jgi:hypothetical protein